MVSQQLGKFTRRVILRRANIAALAVLTLSFVMVGSVLAGFAQVNVDQCSNNNNVLGQCKWINGIVQGNGGNSIYNEGMGVPQRVIWKGVTGGSTHTITFEMQWSKGGVHGYDYLMSYSQAQATSVNLGPFALTLNECADLGGFTADCNAVTGGGSSFVDINAPDDPYMSKDGSTQDRINAFEGLYGNRTIRLRADQPITSAVLTLSHDVGNGLDTGDSFVRYTLVFTSSAPTVMLQMAGHIARSIPITPTPPWGWGVGLGAGAISGGPWHFKNFKFDGSGGSQDNQITNAQPTAVRLLTLTANTTANFGTMIAVLALAGGGIIAAIGLRRFTRRQSKT